MSSFLAHSLIGFAIGRQKRDKSSFKINVAISVFFIVLATAPDIDYLINFIRGVTMPIRYTHSIGYIFFVTIFSLLLRSFSTHLQKIAPIFFFSATFSHLILDFLVGVHGNPYLYPFSEVLFTSSLGILPSAGRIDVNNYYFWRNLLIELMIFLPILILLVAYYREKLFKQSILKYFILCIFILGVALGYNLKR